ncbi:hypothetical protein LSH36_463g00023 [Paralvinella palmiformis]|uniref:Uncharacterized protein n=1 Tax=Paralvinella palmiformis TaxID=53620 RepID=A0AAD9MZX1_9ANNE|nr:hypothetical protein LSH36_463g00023 [Paralvinella palmiformis]
MAYASQLAASLGPLPVERTPLVYPFCSQSDMPGNQTILHPERYAVLQQQALDSAIQKETEQYLQLGANLRYLKDVVNRLKLSILEDENRINIFCRRP